ncbi:ribokinase [Roseinatronobacter sp. S2]|uniref:ribokinase n=1 Tax=Roseinatronobacter sp. S2 TaxID=3035471 RepID=UPI00240F8903|nr:ribokinase [Roseinatronobacter sp. S2]WFE75162.1 ribokinase [Roseinatronobacter sp. S2]
MQIWNFGSINIDHVHRLDHLPYAGETLASRDYTVQLGGKGANQSVAAARAGATVRHLGAIGADGLDMRDVMTGYGVDCGGVQVLDGATGHAIIMVDQSGENAIVLHGGANHALALDPLLTALKGAGAGDFLLMQNETAWQPEIAAAAAAAGMKVVYSAAPFSADAVQAVLPFVSMLMMNDIEAQQLQDALGVAIADLPVENVVVTHGAKGASWHGKGRAEIFVPALSVPVLDTTGAGDCFAGALVAALSDGKGPADAMKFAACAAALQVSRAGAASAMPSRAQIDALAGEGG